MYKSLIIGLGKIGLTYDLDPKRIRPSSHTFAYLQDSRFELIGAMDQDEGCRSLLSAVDENISFYHDIDQMLSDHQVDVISICTPPEHHLSCIKKILDNQIPRIIFCEKPLVSRLSDATCFLNDSLIPQECLIIPNLSRRWSSGMQRLAQIIHQKTYGSIEKVNVRYTRGIYNTGAHMFDLLRWFFGNIDKVCVIGKTYTTSEYDNEPSYNFVFEFEGGCYGIAEAFDDRNYYMFEMDFYFTNGKIEIRESGNKVSYWHTGDHPLFSGFSSLHFTRLEDNLLQESFLGNAVSHIGDILDGKVLPICTLSDGLYPLFIAEALERSYANQKWEEVVMK